MWGPFRFDLVAYDYNGAKNDTLQLRVVEIGDDTPDDNPNKVYPYNPVADELPKGDIVTTIKN